MNHCHSVENVGSVLIAGETSKIYQQPPANTEHVAGKFGDRLVVRIGGAGQIWATTKIVIGGREKKK